MGVSKWEKAKAAKRRIAAIANRSNLSEYTIADGRIKATAYAVDKSIIRVDGRDLREDWTPDPQKLCRAMDACGKHRGLHRKAGRLGIHVYGCGQALCPDCARRRGTKRAGAMLPVIAHLVAQGYQVAQLTTTQIVGPNLGRPVVLLSQAEEDHHKAALESEGAMVTRDGWSVPGESLGAALDRHRDSHERLRDGRAVVDTGEESRGWWKRTVRAFVQGIEWTGKAPGGFLRWHVHSHMVLVLDPSVNVDDWFKTFAARWSSVSAGALDHAQDLTSATGNKVEQAVFHALKYPFKPASLTHAQILEVLAAAKGRRFNHVGGAFHAQSRVGRAVAAMLEGNDPPGWDDLNQADRVLVQDLVDAKTTEDRTPIEVAYRRRKFDSQSWVDSQGNRVTSHRPEPSVRPGIVVDGAEWIPVTLGHLAASHLAGQSRIDTVLWRSSETHTDTLEPLPIAPAILAASIYGQVDGPDLTLTAAV